MLGFHRDAALVYAVEELGVKHIIVMGHYGCPTVGAALMGNTTTTTKNKNHVQPANSTQGGNHTSTEVEAWMQPIRDVYLSSNRQACVFSFFFSNLFNFVLRSEIIALRSNSTTFTTLPEASNGMHTPLMFVHGTKLLLSRFPCSRGGKCQS